MNTFRTIQGAAVGAALTLVGCGRDKEAEAPSTSTIQGLATNAVPPAIERPSTNAVSVTDQATTEDSIKVIPKVLDAAATNIQAGASVALDRVAQLLETAQKRVDGKKWNEALSLLEQLTGQPLTPDQETVLRNLRDQIKAGVRAAAAPKIGQEINRLLEDSRTPK